MSRRPFSAVRTEGGLLPQDLLARIQAGDSTLAGTKARSYHLGPHERIGEAVNRSWTRLVATWHAFQDALAKQPEDALATGLTRERWLLPLFQELGYGRLPKGSAIEVEGRSYAVSHTWHRSPIHLLGAGVDLDQRQKGVAGAAKSSPHGLVQEFLNRSDDHLWGFVTNGYRLRVLRDHHSLTRQAYVEFDLQAIMDGEQYSEFLLLWLVCHQSRVEADKPEECWLETWCASSREEGVRALDKLRGGVEKAIEAFGAGFLASKANNRLHEALASGELDAQEYYRQVLRLVYRLIFLFVAEERDALLDPDASETAKERYRRYYATRRLRDLADKRRGSPHGDLWRGVALVMDKLDGGYPPLALPALGSRLWGPTACPWLMDAECANTHVLSAVRQLSHIQDGRTRYPVNWRNVGADELGSIYEGLLELHPRIHAEAGTFKLDTAAGHERKTTGSYYTPTSLVDCLLDSALDPVLDEAAKKGADAILALKVCDPACGSGHFLVAAARRIAKRLASVRSGDDEPSPRDVQRALRDVVGRCVFGVDVNPMAVELCKVSLWMEAIEPGRPLSFLDSHIQCGNALLGTTPALMARGIPDDAFKPIEGDDKEVAKRLKKRNRDERKTKQERLPFMRPEDKQIFDEFVACDMGPDFDLASVREQETCWVNLNRSRAFRDAKFMADAWCAAFVWPKQAGEKEEAAVTQNLWRRMQRDAMAAPRTTRRIVQELSRQFAFFHWHLAFPAVFGEVKPKFGKGETTGWTGGFDVVLGNPPWERIKLQEKEFFASRAPKIAGARTAAARKREIARLERDEPLLWVSWSSAVRSAEGSIRIVRDSGRFPLCGRGDINTYSIFAELDRTLIRSSGRSGCIVPTGIATDATTQYYFADLIDRRTLVCLFGFENEGKLFKGVDHRVNFCIIVVNGQPHEGHPEFSAFVRHPDLLRDPDRRYRLTATEIGLINPNTRTCPVFRTRRDAELTKAVHRRASVLWREDGEDGNPWDVSFRSMFHMSGDSGLFRAEEDLPAPDWTRQGNAFRSGQRLMLPLYEAKMIYHYNHRFGDFGLVEPGKRAHILPSPDLDLLRDPTYVPSPRYWVAAEEVDARVDARWPHEWFIGWRDVTDPRSSVRTVVSSIVPRTAVSGKLPLLLSTSRDPWLLAANLASFVLDYFGRQKIGGVSLSMFVMRQLPLLPPSEFSRECAWAPGSSVVQWLRPRVLELTYTCWDLAPFARDLGYYGPPFKWDVERRFELRCELDAAFFQLYGLGRNDVDFVMESFPIVRRKDEKRQGSFRTKERILEIHDEMHAAAQGRRPYLSSLGPPAADRGVAHSEATRPSWAGTVSSLVLPAVMPKVGLQHAAALISWALLRQRGNRVTRIDLARAFALLSAPNLLLRLAPAELHHYAQPWAQRVGNRTVGPGTLAQGVQALLDRDGVRLATDSSGSVVLEATSHTPPADRLDDWYLFEAQLALAVLDALPAGSLSTVDGSMSAEDRQLLAGGA